MKTTTTLLLLFLLNFYARSQTFTLNFEDSSAIRRAFYTDSLLDTLGIWQIGAPHKTHFASAYSAPNAIVTLLDSSLPSDTRASFILKLDAGFEYPFSQLSFEQKFDLDTLHSGGYIEFSTDSGRMWLPVKSWDDWAYWGSSPTIRPFWENPPYQLDRADTTVSGAAILRGSSLNWSSSTLKFPCHAAKTEQILPLWFKFTVFSDSNAVPHEGWMIDNITFNSPNLPCSGIYELNSSLLHIYPNPIEEAFTVSVTDLSFADYTITVCDLMGRELIHKDSQSKDVIIPRSNAAAGTYIVRVTDHMSKSTLQKRVVFE